MAREISRKYSYLILLIIMTSASPSLGAQPVIPGNPVPLVDTLMKAEPRNADAFVPQSDGSVRHIQSGFVCPAQLPNVNLWNLLAYATPQPGTDIGCDYGRVPRGQTGPNAESKFTIFLVKAQPGVTLDQAFKHYQDEMHGSYPNSRILGEMVGVTSALAANNGASTFPLSKSEKDELNINNRPFMNELIVTIAGDWIIEIRSTYPTQFSAGDPAAGIDLPAAVFVWATLVKDFAAANAIHRP